jgi:uncharacterized protein YdhG (YjbR/CyaY superfamily)
MQEGAKDVDEYIELQSENARNILTEIRQTIKKTVPDAEEFISYQMPAFKYHGMLAWYAVFTHHYSIFISPRILDLYQEELEAFELSKSKSGIKIPLEKPAPVQLISKIIKSVAQANLEKAQLKRKGGK